MPRIPDDELARLKQAIRLDRLAALRGLTLERAGADAVKAQGGPWTCIRSIACLDSFATILS